MFIIMIVVVITIMNKNMKKNNLKALRAYTATVPMRQNDVPEVSRRWAQVSWNTHGTRGGRKSDGTRGGPKSEGLRSFFCKVTVVQALQRCLSGRNFDFLKLENHKIRQHLLRRRLRMDLSGVLGPSCSL